MKQHIDVKHKDLYSYIYSKCNKGFTSRSGYKKHKLQHKSKEEIEKLGKEDLPAKGTTSSGVFVCKNAAHEKEVYFMSAQAFRKHVKEQHRDPKIFSCTGCQKQFGSKGNLQQKWQGCPQIPGRVAKYCPIENCKKGPYYLDKKNYKNTREMYMVSRSLLLSN